MDFSLILFIAAVGTGAVTLGWRWRVKITARRQPEAPAVAPPLLVEYARALFPIVLFVFVLRAFVVEPFRIPSGSMLPSLHIGDFILVNKFSYGLRLPIWNRKIVEIGAPRRGDVVVFRPPHLPQTNFIKRIVGLPGDMVAYKNRQLTINGEAMPQTEAGIFWFEGVHQRGRHATKYVEKIYGADHVIMREHSFPQAEIKFTVPAESYFVMGDNRDNSNDSRGWGFVADEKVVGKAFVIWFSWKGWSQGLVRWSRLGKIIH